MPHYNRIEEYPSKQQRLLRGLSATAAALVGAYGTSKAMITRAEDGMDVVGSVSSDVSDTMERVSGLKRRIEDMFSASESAKPGTQAAGGISDNGGSIHVEPTGSRKSKVKLGPTTKNSKKTMRDIYSNSRPMIGDNLIPSLSTNQLTGVVLNKQNTLGTHDPIGLFLSNLMQRGQVVSQFAGLIEANSNLYGDQSRGTRTVICQNFRHRFSDDLTINFGNYDANNAAYPTGYGTILTPYADAYTLPGTSGGTNNGTSISGAMHVHKPNENCWAALNRADMEDMMWNLNKLKLAPQGQGGNANILLWRSAPRFMEDKHRRQSSIEINNLEASSLTTSVDPIVPSPAPYKFDAVFFGGHVKYHFMNKESTGARVEVIVYRMKKNTRSNNQYTAYEPLDPTVTQAGDLGYQANPLNNIVSPIMAGYRDKYIGKLGTDNMDGNGQDMNFFKGIYNNPEYPLLPHYKATKQSLTAYKEVSRTAVALPAGGSRDVTVQLDGIKYDPSNAYNFLNRTSPGGDTLYQLPGIMDEYSYAIVIAVCGVKMSRMIADKKADPSTGVQSDELVQAVIGDIHSNATIQYTAEYVENIGAASYKKPGRVNLYNNCLAKDSKVKENNFTTTTSTSVVGVTTLPVEKTIRLTNTSSTPGSSSYVG